MRTVIRSVSISFVVLLTACGVDSSDGAEVATGDEVPYGLVDPAETTTTTAPGARTSVAHAWFVGDGRLVRVARDVARPPTVGALLEVLAAGPTEDEASFGLRSAVVVDSVNDANVMDGVATVDLRTQFTSAPAREQILALAQLVYTVTERRSVEVVTFTLDRQPIDVPRADGSISDGRVTRTDYAPLASVDG